MRRKWLAAVLCLLVLTGCRGRALPGGMDQEELLRAGVDVVELIAGGDLQEVHNRLRSDVAGTVSLEDLRKATENGLEGAGTYRYVESSMTTGQSSDGEEYGVAVLYCRFAGARVLFRVAFDPEMNLIGLEVRRQ